MESWKLKYADLDRDLFELFLNISNDCVGIYHLFKQ